MRVKKLVYLEVEQDKRVKQLARKAKISATEVIRRAIDAYESDETAHVTADKRRVMEYIKAHPTGWADDPAEFFRG